MKIICAKSGLELEVSYFPGEFASREISHPIFSMSQKKLLGYVTSYAELNGVDSYLLFLSLLNSTELVDFRLPVLRTDTTAAMIAQTFESLFQVIGQINLITNYQAILPQFVISKETRDLDNVFYWIESWLSAIAEYKDNYKTTGERNKLINREFALEKLIKNPKRDLTSYSAQLAEWAALAGNFPTGETTAPNGAHITLSEYWKSIIRKCCKSESIFEIPAADLEELIEHCEENIIHGSIYSANLMKLLRAGKTKQSSFLGIDFSSTSFALLSDDSTVEDANKLALINSAPDSLPEVSQYPTKLAYLRAKLKYDMKQRYDAEQNSAANNIAVHTSVGDI